MNGYNSKYLYYESNKNSLITIPRPIIEANNLDWNHKDDIKIMIKNIDGQVGLFLFKKGTNPESRSVQKSLTKNKSTK